MLTLHRNDGDTLWDHLLPEGARVLPEDLARLDEVLADPRMVAPFRARFERLADQCSADPLHRGRPTIPMATYLRLMVIKHRTGWGYEALVREVSDSLHLRRFCLIPLTSPVPDESTVRKLTRRLGHEVVDECIRGVIGKALRERRFRPRALRVDSTVAEADIRYPTDVGLAADAVRVLARSARRVRAAVPTVTRRVRDRSRAVGKRLRALGRTLRRRTGEAKAAVRRLTEETAEQARACLGEAKRVLAQARRSRSRAPGISRAARARAIASLEQAIGLAERVVEQTRMRFAGEKIADRLVSLFDPDARPVRRGKLAKPNQFGYVVQLTEVTANTRRGARGLLLPPSWRPARPTRTPCCPPPPPSWTRWGSRSGRPPWTPGSSGSGPRRPWPRRAAPRCSSPATPTTPGHREPAAAGPGSGWAARAGSPTSSATTGPAGLGSKAPRAPGSGRAGQCSPTTWTRWPGCQSAQAPADSPGALRQQAQTADRKDQQAPPVPNAHLRGLPLYPGEVTKWR
jgi:transposase, IS5 family